MFAKATVVRWREDNVDVEAHEFSGNRGESFVLSFRRPDFEFDALALDPSQLTQPMPECVEVRVGANGTTNITPIR